MFLICNGLASISAVQRYSFQSRHLGISLIHLHHGRNYNQVTVLDQCGPWGNVHGSCGTHSTLIQQRLGSRRDPILVDHILVDHMKSSNHISTLAARCAAIFGRHARVWTGLLMLLFAGFFWAPCVRADVGIVLNESLDTSVARITGSGHSAVYLSRVCPETPVKLRLCRPGEEGSVISNYTTLGEDQPYEWNVVPLSMYLYGVEDPQNRPLFGSEKVKHALEERYRLKYLAGYCESESCQTSNKAEWREMVAATVSRSLYIFVVKTTLEKDEQFIRAFNAGRNQNHFNGVTRNCATFTRSVMNAYFPHSTKPDYINDFGMTSPKAIARSFTKYALKHPDADFHVLHFAQIPGTYKRSSECRDGTEQLYHSKKLLVPMAIFADHELAVVTGSYLLTGRFNPEHEWEKYPTEQVTAISYDVKVAKRQDNQDGVRILEAAEDAQRVDVVGTRDEWTNYRQSFDELVGMAVREEAIPNVDYLNRLFKRIDEGMLTVEADGSLSVNLKMSGEARTLGLSADNILASTSDSQLAYQLMLGRIGRVLTSPKHSRENILELKADWALLQQARANVSISLAIASALGNGAHALAKPAGN